ncbi:LysR family transcriptional regulator [Hasllibacter halocynthiae]|uniref:LysR family transcriptional regulator n=1 Tax=Hasllibacter halocynthiae TaxID=595589 RepID=A0A2T0WZJ5_9RHOB|nr:LysR family transcriptional regulator [Hasllibacter halocynthiae]PRY92065.1 LysR family transcriptional regulator [Hasllibacter halocynthiae]
MDLNALKEFVAVARAGSFAKAALGLGTPKSTVSKRVQDLEAALGVRLIERTTRASRLTAEGTALLPRAERILADAREAERLVAAGGSEPEGHLRLRMPSLFAQAFGGRLIAACGRAHPAITLEIVLLDRPVDLMAEGFDGAVHVGPLADSGRAARVFAEAETIPVGAPGLFEARAVPRTPADLSDLPALLHGRDLKATWPLFANGRRFDVPVSGRAAAGSLTVLRDAALAGAGIAYLPEFVVQGDLEGGALVRLLPHHSGTRTPLSFVYPSPHSITVRLRAFIEVLVAQFPERTLPRL